VQALGGWAACAGQLEAQHPPMILDVLGILAIIVVALVGVVLFVSAAFSDDPFDD
jgi:hypothetical protein